MSTDQQTPTLHLDLEPGSHHTGTASLVLGASACLALGTLPALPYLVLLALPFGIAAVASGAGALRRGVATTPGRINSITGVTLGSLGVLGWAALMVLWFLVDQAVSH
ncbi:hypothetical protein OG594_23685 [Streptomyces sp. NBC_01214]|uniref:hypothetical protein n=1 Tax=Streptomyces sp. NBC_01214 TaxID=2903777 RepID=UPI0022532EA7|nr:hypothetical protein [Streptomyces sp. NBC_01214]MCX4804593.1 hypothetical protein [Streptomyces sp. NBC_01214]